MMDDNFRSGVMGDKLHTKLTRSGRPIAKFVQIFLIYSITTQACRAYTNLRQSLTQTPLARTETPVILKPNRCQPSASKFKEE